MCVGLIGCDQGSGFKDSIGGVEPTSCKMRQLICSMDWSVEGNSFHTPSKGFFAFEGRYIKLLYILYNTLLIYQLPTDRRRVRTPPVVSICGVCTHIYICSVWTPAWGIYSVSSSAYNTSEWMDILHTYSSQPNSHSERFSLPILPTSLSPPCPSPHAKWQPKQQPATH
jgi:hypothetical protein